MRKISEIKVVSMHTADRADNYAREVSSLVMGGFTPYGKPYYHGSWMFRDFVKFEYHPIEDRSDSVVFDDDEEEVSEDPWEHHDFFEDV